MNEVRVPAGRLGTVYLLHFDRPTIVREADNGHVQPTTHYVGWTSRPVRQRVREHAVPADSLALEEPGTTADEAQLKRTGRCPRCSAPLDAECLSAVPDDDLTQQDVWLLALLNGKIGTDEWLDRDGED